MTGYIPLNYEQLNLIQGGYTPSCVKAFNNKAFAFWERALFQRACSVVDFSLPEDWNGGVRDLFYYIMFKFGYAAVFDHEEYGKIFQPASLTGYDVFYRPTNAIIANPVFKSLDLKIGSECAIVKLTPDYVGVWDIISYYAEKLALLDNAINISLINNKYAFMLGAKNKSAGEALKKMLDRINEGVPAIIFDQKLANDPNDKSEPWQFWNRGNLKESYLTSDQLKDFQTILNNFDCEIGIPTLPEAKKERMITDEANMRKNDAVSRSKIWIDTFNSSAVEANRLFGLSLSAKLNYESEVIENAE
jgi:hypothetical protein